MCSQINDVLERQNGFDVWYDKGLVPGEVYRKKIAEVIRDSGYFIILLSESSVHSDWVLDEVEYAKKLRKKILPIWIEDVELPDDLDMILQRYHSLFWYLRTSDSQFEKSLNSVFEIGEEPKQKCRGSIPGRYSAEAEGDRNPVEETGRITVRSSESVSFPGITLEVP